MIGENIELGVGMRYNNTESFVERRISMENPGMTDYTEWAREYFKDDRFATKTTGVVIEEAREGYARCTLKIEDKHLSAMNTVMGGALFTIADFTFAVAANSGQQHTVLMTSSIVYLSPARGSVITAEANCIKSGKRTCTYCVDIFDENGVKVVTATCVGHRI